MTRPIPELKCSYDVWQLTPRLRTRAKHEVGLGQSLLAAVGGRRPQKIEKMSRIEGCVSLAIEDAGIDAIGRCGPGCAKNGTGRRVTGHEAGQRHCEGKRQDDGTQTHPREHLSVPLTQLTMFIH